MTLQSRNRKKKECFVCILYDQQKETQMSQAQLKWKKSICEQQFSPINTAEEKHPHCIMLPPPCFTVETVYSLSRWALLVCHHTQHYACRFAHTDDWNVTYHASLIYSHIKLHTLRLGINFRTEWSACKQMNTSTYNTAITYYDHALEICFINKTKKGFELF